MGRREKRVESSEQAIMAFAIGFLDAAQIGLSAAIAVSFNEEKARQAATPQVLDRESRLSPNTPN